MPYRPDPRAGAAFDGIREFFHRRWVQRVLTGLAAAIAFAIVISIAWRFVLSEDTSALTSSETRSPLGEGSPAALPFGRGQANAPRETDASTADVSALRQVYMSAEDRHAFFRAAQGRPEPEAKYLAYRAANDCMIGLRQMSDAIEIDQAVREAIAREGGGHEQMQQRLAAAEALKRMCGGFLRPAALPYADMHRLLNEAAAAGHPAALAAQRTPATELASVVTRAVQSGDALAFAEAAPALSRLAFTHRVAGVEATPQSIFAIQVAVDAAACRISKTCAPGSPRALADCVHGAACDATSTEDALLQSPLIGPNAAMAQKLAADIEAAFRRRDVAFLVAARR